MRTRPAAGLQHGLRAPAALLALVGALLAWWSWENGAFFGTVFYPGAIVTFGLLAVLVLAVPLGARIEGPARIALLSLVLLGCWTLLAALWSPSPSIAFADASKDFTYAALFAIGIWTCRMLGDRILLSLAPVAVVGMAVGVGIAITLATGHDVGAYVHLDDATLRFPIGYRNAEAAFLFICTWALLALAVEGRAAWPMRAAMLAGVTMLLELNVLSQSRGSLPAAAVALVVYLTLSPQRLRPVVYLALAAIPAAIALPTLLEPFRHGVSLGFLPLLRSSSKEIALTSLLSLGLAALCLGAIEPRVQIGPDWTRRISRAVAAAMVVATVAGVTVFVAERGGPVHFLNQKLGQFEQSQSPTFAGQATRFGTDVSSQRSDLWRVSLREFADHPLDGGGPGSFEFRYLHDRNTYLTPKDPHSVEMLMLSELGLPGFALFVAFVVGGGAAALRTRRVGRAAAGLAAGALTCASYWLAHSSLDWFWRYPAITAPVMFLLGAAAAPALAGSPGIPRKAKAMTLAVLAVLAAGFVPFYLSERYTNRAIGEWTANLPGAYRDLDSAASLNPFDNEPLLLKGAIASRVGERALALASFRKAGDRVPADYAAYYFIAQELLRSDPAAAAAEVAKARALNPNGADVRLLERRVKRALARPGVPK